MLGGNSTATRSETYADAALNEAYNVLSGVTGAYVLMELEMNAPSLLFRAIVAGPVLFFGVSAQAACNTTAWMTTAVSPTAKTDWKIAKGTNCRQTIRLGAAGSGNLRITVRPTHGAAGVSNSMADPGFAYQASGGFLGNDHFQVQWERTAPWTTTPLTYTLDINVDVVEKL